MTPEDLETLDRLEQKVRLLVTEMGRSRAEHAKQAVENRRLSEELQSALAKLADAEGAAAAEMATMRQERDQVRSRVAGILEHLEGLDI